MVCWWLLVHSGFVLFSVSPYGTFAFVMTYDPPTKSSGSIGAPLHLLTFGQSQPTIILSKSMTCKYTLYNFLSSFASASWEVVVVVVVVQSHYLVQKVYHSK
jgi:hypothetical protein